MKKGAFLLSDRGQSLLEYCLLIVIIIAAIGGMKTYVSRSICGRLREASNEIAEQHYVPGKMKSNMTTRLTGNRSTIVRQETFFDPGTERNYRGMASYVITGPGIEGKPSYNSTKPFEVMTKTGNEKIE